MERALESGLSLGRATLDSMLLDVVAKGRLAASDLNGLSLRHQSENLDRVRERFGISEAVILTSGGRIIQSSGGRYAALVPDLPSPTALRQARLAHHYAAIEGNEPREDNPDQSYQALRMRVMVPIISSDVREELRFLQFVQPVPMALAQNAEAVQGASVTIRSCRCHDEDSNASSASRSPSPSCSPSSRPLPPPSCWRAG